MAKTVMGSYSASDVMDHLRNQGNQGGQGGPVPGQQAQRPAPAQPQQRAPAPAQNPYQTPAPQAHGPGSYPGPASAQAPTQVPNPYQGPSAVGPQAPTQVPNPYQAQGGNPYPQPGPHGGNPYPQPPQNPQQHGGAPYSPASAAPTLFIPGGGAVPQGQGPQPGPGPRPMQPTPAPYAPQAGAFQAAPGPGPAYSPQPYHPPPQAPPQPIAPLPPPLAAPYGIPQATARAGRPIEPWKDSLRMMMFIWGGLLLLTFIAPITLEPITFQWDQIIHGEGKTKLPPLIIAAVGLLSVVLALIPTSPAPRGLIAGVLGLAGILIPAFLGGMPHWKLLLPLGGMLVLVTGLLVRHEYRESIAPRILVTVGALAVLALSLLPVNGELPFVGMFKAAIETPGPAKIDALLEVFYFVIVVLTLLAWLPAPASAGAKAFAWILILQAAVVTLVAFVLAAIAGTFTLDATGELIGWVPGAAYLVLVGYGFATVIGKKLE